MNEKLISLEDHNNHVLRTHNTLLTGIQCPRCGDEIQYADRTIMLSSPGKKNVVCFGCNFKGTAYVNGYR